MILETHNSENTQTKLNKVLGKQEGYKYKG